MIRMRYSLANKRSWAFGAIFLLVSGCAAAARVIYPLNEEAGRVQAGTYTLDPEHTSLIFAVDHLGFSTFYSRFNTVTGTLNLDHDHVENSSVSITIDAASIDTHVPALDSQLTAHDMLDAARYPQARFTSTRIVRTGDDTARIEGILKLRDKTAPVTLQARFHGSGTFKRSVFGLSKWLPLVGDDINLTISVEFRR